jgi:hypothetical protein
MKHYLELEDHFKGQPVVVIGNGASLADVPTELFEKYPTFGMNSIYANEYLNDNPVDVYTIEGLGHLNTPEERAERMPYIQAVADNGGISLVNRRMLQYFQHLPEVYAVDYVSPSGGAYNHFQFQPFTYYGTGSCVTYAVLQFAYYMTTGTVLLVGIDHKFVDGNWHGYDEDNAPEFDPMPQKEYQKFRMRVDPKFSECAEVYRVTGRKLLNLTPDSAAGMFEKDTIENWL